MAIVRAPRPDSNFYLLDKKISEDGRLSWAARGMLIFLLGKPDNWSVSVAALVNQTKGSAKRSGRDAVYGLIGELVSVGYITRTQQNGAGGFGEVDYLVSETPVALTDFQEASVSGALTDSPDTGEPFTANPTQVSIDKNKQGLTKNIAAAGAPETKPVKRSSSLPDGFALTDDDVEYAVSRFIDYATEFEGFVNFHKAKGTLMKDWRAAWRTWVGNAVKFGKARAPSKPAAPVFNPHDKSTWGRDARGKFSSSLYLQDEAKAYRMLNGIPEAQVDAFERDMGAAEVVE